MTLEIRCPHCGTYPVESRDHLRDLATRTALRGVPCFRCDEEAHALVDGVRVPMRLVNEAADELLVREVSRDCPPNCRHICPSCGKHSLAFGACLSCGHGSGSDDEMRAFDLLAGDER